MNTQALDTAASLQNSLLLIENALEFGQSKGIFKLKDASEITAALIVVEEAMKELLNYRDRANQIKQDENYAKFDFDVPTESKPQPTRKTKNG